MKRATRMALVTGEMSDCMSGAGAGQSGVELRVCPSVRPYVPLFSPPSPGISASSPRRRSGSNC